MIRRLLAIFFRLTTTDKSPRGLRETFEELGPTFVKLGQLLSTRPDIVPKEYSEEFRKLLDKNKPIQFGTVKHIIEREIRKNIFQVFKRIDKISISSASIGQVHKAILKNGEKVVIKVRKPGVKKHIEKDIQLLKILSGILCRFSFFKSIGLKKIIEEFSWCIHRELNFETEANQAKLLAKNLEYFDYITIPHVYNEFSTEQLLVLEYIEGITMNEVFDRIEKKHTTDMSKLDLPFTVNPKKIISEMLECYIFKQILQDGLFHGDPHPANIILMPDDKFALVDFGIMGVLDKKEHSQILMTILGIIEDDPKIVLDVLTSITEREFSKKEELDVSDAIAFELHKIHGGTLKEATIGELMLNIISIGRTYNLHWSPSMVLGMRAIALVEGIGFRLIPDASIVEFVKPHLRTYLIKEVLHRFSPEEIYINLLQLSRVLQNLKMKIEEKG